MQQRFGGALRLDTSRREWAGNENRAHSQWLYFTGFRVKVSKNTILISVKDQPFLPGQCLSPVPSKPNMVLLENLKNKFILWKVYGVPIIWIISSIEYTWLISALFSFDTPVDCIWNSVSIWNTEELLQSHVIHFCKCNNLNKWQQLKICKTIRLFFLNRRVSVVLKDSSYWIYWDF